MTKAIFGPCDLSLIVVLLDESVSSTGIARKKVLLGSFALERIFARQKMKASHRSTPLIDGTYVMLVMKHYDDDDEN